MRALLSSQIAANRLIPRRETRETSEPAPVLARGLFRRNRDGVIVEALSLCSPLGAHLELFHPMYVEQA